jgi:hypothetical protein
MVKIARSEIRDPRFKSSLNKRKSQPQSLAAAFGGLLKIFGGRASDADLAARWREIMGSDIANLCDLEKISGASNKIAYIKVKNPSMALPLSYRASEIKEKINAYFGREFVGKIIVKK